MVEPGMRGVPSWTSEVEPRERMSHAVFRSQIRDLPLAERLVGYSIATHPPTCSRISADLLASVSYHNHGSESRHLFFSIANT
jgi:hypothetical protein